MSLGPMGWMVLLALAGARIQPEEILVFAAASTTDSLQEIATRFERQTGERVVFSFGASSELARQILAGAPADVFFSADREQMDRLAAAGLVQREAIRPLLSNQLVVIVPRGSAVEIKSPADLRSLPTLALADPEAVPAGVYARHFLEASGLWRALRTKVIPTLDVRAALAVVETEHAAAAIVYRTDAASSKRVRVVYRVPRAQGPDIVYPVARLARSQRRSAAALVEFLAGSEARRIFARFGFIVL